MSRQAEAIRKIIDNEDDLGEVAEWVGKSAAQQGQNDDDDDFDVGQDFATQAQKLQIEEARRKINEKLAKGGSSLAKRQGPLVNNLRDKAKILALQNTTYHENPKEDPESSGDEHEVAVVQGNAGEESPDKKVLDSQQNLEFEQANKERLIELQQQQPKKEIAEINFIEAWRALKSSRELKSPIQFKEPKRNLVEKLFGCFTVHLKSSTLIQEKDQVCLLTQMSFDDNNDTHFRVLYTIFCQFMNTNYCLRYGEHWVTIGFQGRDPATDLRGAGIFGLMQILAFLSQYSAYIKKCLQTAQQLQFPLCITLINITTFVMIALKDNKLNSMINRENEVMSVVNKVYFAGFFKFFTVYKQSGTFHTIGATLDQVRKQIYDSPQRIVEEFTKSIHRFYKTQNQ